jgi:1-acyl-sn-glycerol-3-phosphate acyltransferase
MTAGRSLPWPAFGGRTDDEPYRLESMLRALVTCGGQVLVLVFALPVLWVAGLFGRPQRLIAFLSRSWSRVILFLAGVRLSIEGIEHTRGEPRFFVGNHPGALDIPVLLVALRGHIRFMAKKGLFRIPVFGQVLRRYGFVPIDRAHPRAALRALEDMLDDLHRHPISFAVFPEGTRSPDGRLLPFRKGSLKICRDSGLSVVPFAIEGTNLVYTRGRVCITPGPVRITFVAPIPADVVAGMTTQELHDRVRAEIAGQLEQARDPSDNAIKPARAAVLAPDGA